MKALIKNKYVWIGAALLVVGLVAWWLWPSSNDDEKALARCQKGFFETGVTAMGEIEAAVSVDVSVPQVMYSRNLPIWSLKINDMVAEGTLVKKGDYVANLDPGDVENELKRAMDEIAQVQNNIEDAKLDSTLKLTSARVEIRNAEDELVERQIKVDQSIYESKAYQRQATIELERVHREFIQKKRNYQKQQRRLELGIERHYTDLKRWTDRRDMLMELKMGLNVKAPADGMVIYAKNWVGNKIKVGDDVGRFMPVIANFPDLNTLVSITYVQEVDIKHVEVGQQVRMTVDAFPEEKFTGTIVKIANIGQKIKGKEMNGFKVEIKMDPYRARILPGMTTNNYIVTGQWNDALTIPRTAVFGTDTCRYVFLKDGFKTFRQEILLGGETESLVRVLDGLKEKDAVLLKQPENVSELPLFRLKSKAAE
jgi:multidrug efflux pump subunit AcrA (membrane-fusion protein)